MQTERAFETRRMQIYAAMVDLMDEQIGRVFAYLEGNEVITESGEYQVHVYQPRRAALAAGWGVR